MTTRVRSFTDSLVVIYDNDGYFITKTMVTGHNRHEMYIEVTDGLEYIKPGSRLRLLIIHSAGASEFGGALKQIRQGIYELSLFGERPRSARGTSRHALNSSAFVSEIIINSEKVALAEPASIIIENISTTGVLVRSPELQFILGVTLQIEFSINGRSTIVYGKTVREQLNADKTYSYGCRLVFLK